MIRKFYETFSNLIEEDSFIFCYFRYSLSQVVKIAAALGVFFGYPIQFFIMIRIIWPNIKQNSSNAQKYPITIQVVLRFFMVLCTCKYFHFFFILQCLF